MCSLQSFPNINEKSALVDANNEGVRLEQTLQLTETLGSVTSVVRDNNPVENGIFGSGFISPTTCSASCLDQDPNQTWS